MRTPGSSLKNTCEALAHEAFTDEQHAQLYAHILITADLKWVTTSKSQQLFEFLQCNFLFFLDRENHHQRLPWFWPLDNLVCANTCRCRFADLLCVYLFYPLMFVITYSGGSETCMGGGLACCCWQIPEPNVTTGLWDTF